jgi:hypothetical protein
VDIVDVPNAVQSIINVVNLVDLPISHPDYHAVLIANYILGGGANSRLFMTLREKRGFTYGSYSGIKGSRFQTKFSASASVRNEKTDSAVADILQEINLLRTTPVTAEELQNAKNLYNGSFAIQLENPATIAEFTTNILINNLPKDFYRTYLQKINAVNVADVQRVAQKYFNYANTRVVVTGRSAQITEPLQRLSSVPRLTRPSGHGLRRYLVWAWISSAPGAAAGPTTSASIPGACPVSSSFRTGWTTIPGRTTPTWTPSNGWCRKTCAETRSSSRHSFFSRRIVTVRSRPCGCGDGP